MQEDLLNNFWTYKKSFTTQNQWNFIFYLHLKKCTVVWQILKKMTKFRIKLLFKVYFILMPRFLKFIKIISSEKLYLPNNILFEYKTYFVFISAISTLCTVSRAIIPKLLKERVSSECISVTIIQMLSS